MSTTTRDKAQAIALAMSPYQRFLFLDHSRRNKFGLSWETDGDLSKDGELTELGAELYGILLAGQRGAS